MLRGAAKNHASVAALCDPEDYEPVLAELRDGGISAETRSRLAAKAFATTAAYDAAIATWFNGREAFPDRLVVSLEKEQELTYGENPHQRGAYYAERGVRRHLLSRVEQLHGKELSFNNLNDLSGARALAREFDLPACVIVKHANPCGAAVGATLEEAYDKALACDPVSAYGGVVVLNREVETALGEKIAEQFVEVLFAPGYTGNALAALQQKKNTRILLDSERRARATRVSGATSACSAGCSSRTPTQRSRIATAGRSPTGDVSEAQWGDLVFAWRVCKHVSSNAIVLAKDLRRSGSAPARSAASTPSASPWRRRRSSATTRRGASLASDAFFPFADGPQIALDAGVDGDRPAGRLAPRRRSVAAASAAGAAMVFTKRRHFRH